MRRVGQREEHKARIGNRVPQDSGVPGMVCDEPAAAINVFDGQ